MAVTQIRFRRGTSHEWEVYNPVLAVGEPGYDSDEDSFKIGDGFTTWTELPYQTISIESLNTAVSQIETALQEVQETTAGVESALSAATVAASNAQAAATAAAAVGATTDAAIAGQVNTPASATSTAMSAKIKAEAVPRGAVRLPEEYGTIGAGDDGPAINAAVLALRTAGGGRLQLEAGRDYQFTTPLNFRGLEGVEIVGGSFTNSIKGVYASGKPTYLTYTGTGLVGGVPIIPITTYETANLAFRGVNFRYNNAAFTGALPTTAPWTPTTGVPLAGILFGVGDPNKAGTADTTGLTFDHCTFGGTTSAAPIEAGNSGAYNSLLLVDLSGSDTTIFDTCGFYASQYAVGRTDHTIFADVATWMNCKFAPTVTKAHVLNPGSSWNFISGRAAGSIVAGGAGLRHPAFMRCDPTNVLTARNLGSVRIFGMQFQDCTTANTEAWIEFEGRNISIIGCHIAQGGDGAWLLRLSDVTESVLVQGNYIDGVSNGVDYNTKTCYGAQFTGNSFMGSGVIRANTSAMRSYLQAGNYGGTATDAATILGGLTSQKLGFFGSAGVARPTVTGTAAATYDATTQTAINGVITALKNLGLVG